MKSSVIIVFFLMTTGYAQQLKFLVTSKTVQNAADSINSFIEKKGLNMEW